MTKHWILAGGVLAAGVAALVVGLVADAQRPDREVFPSASVTTPYVVVDPAMVQFTAAGRIAVSGEGEIVARTARPADAEAWLVDRLYTSLDGMPTWETLDVSQQTGEPVVDPSASPEPEATPTEEVDEAAADDPFVLETSSDHWRDAFAGRDRLSVSAFDVKPGEMLVFASVDGTPLTSVDLNISRSVVDWWITPLIWLGAALALIGIGLSVYSLVDTRGAQEAGENWIARRRRLSTEGREPTVGRHSKPSVSSDDREGGQS